MWVPPRVSVCLSSHLLLCFSVSLCRSSPFLSLGLCDFSLALWSLCRNWSGHVGGVGSRTEAAERVRTPRALFFLQGNTPRGGEKILGSCPALPRSLSSLLSALQLFFLSLDGRMIV